MSESVAVDRPTDGSGTHGAGGPDPSPSERPPGPRLRLLVFGLVATLGSGFGQTYFVGLFGGRWREEFALGNAELGLLYSSATLLSGLTLIEVGRWLDHVPLRRYTAAVVVAFALGCAWIALAPSAWMLVPGILLLRLCGQGLMGHVGITTVARHFQSGRGRALSIAQLGFPIGEAIFPSLAVGAFVLMSWRGVWWACGAALLVLFLPVLLHTARGGDAPEAGDASGSDDDPGRREVLRDPRFFLILPVILGAPFTVTGLFFHQAAVAEAMGWPLSLLASAFLVYAVLQVAGSLGSGWAVDRWSARRLLRWFLIPMALGCAVLFLGDHPALAFLYLGAMGLSAGANGTIAGALWVELYGTRHIGAIRAMQHAFMVGSTAASPVLFGLAIDAGLGVRDLAGLLALGTLLVAPTLGGAALRPAPGTSRPAGE